jgi:hypothetical protein
MAAIDLGLALSSAKSMGALRNSSDIDRAYIRRKQDKRRKRLSKANKLPLKGENASIPHVPHRLGRKVSSIFQKKDKEWPDSPPPRYSERPPLQPLNLVDDGRGLVCVRSRFALLRFF